MSRLDAVTGALGFTGRAITARLVARGGDVVTLTRRPHLPHPFGERLRIVPADYERPDAIETALTGVDTLYNTIWLRFERGGRTFDRAIRRTAILLEAARRSGVRRVVHISVVGADAGSPLRYWAAKGRAERLVRESGLSWAILRPTILFGRDDILVNNLAWFLRRFPVFALPVDAENPVQPVHVDDVARLAVDLAAGPSGATVDAAGPELLDLGGMVRAVRRAVDSRARIVRLPPAVAFGASRAFGLVLRDVVLTRDEIRALEAGLLVSLSPPTGSTPFSAWVADNGPVLGRTYASELARNYRHVAA